ncbi:MAG: carboxypeptidase-like regulatory domain-containing protein [Candidatus Eremiobacteraeota bacterium]|nr:carboxypeptidase-like regulatory domain-containing protein [Candidatus Eremiobacteraeota bacterium]
MTSETAVRAAPLLSVRLRLPFLAPRVHEEAPSPSPSSSPPPAPVNPKASAMSPGRRGAFGNGPIVLKGTGTYQLAVQRSARNGLTTGSDNYGTALSVVAERRTEQSALSISNSFGYGGSAFSAGGLIVGYRTPGYGLTYGQVTGPADSQLQIGGIARGISLAIPVRNGDVSYVMGTAAQQTPSFNETFRVFGLRRDWNALGGFLALGAYYGAGEQGIGRETIADIGFRRYGAALSTDSEIAVSSTNGIPGSPEGARIATAFQADLQGKSTFTTLSVKFDPAGFQSLTSSVNGGFSADLAIRRHSERFGETNVELAHADDRLDTSVQHDDRLTLSGGKSWAHVGFQYVAGLDRTRVAGTDSLQRSAALTLTESLRSLSLFETFQATSSSQTSGFAAQRQLALGASKPFLGGSLAYQFSRSDSVSGSGSDGTASSQALSFRRKLGKKLDAQFTESFQTSFNNGVATRMTETSVALVRRLSDVVAVQVAADRFHQTGLGGGTGTSFSASLVGPFGFGQPANGAGRANPNLPAVIRGLVTFSTSSSPFAYNAPTLRGLNNALVILDGRITQRTDSSGEFEFRFVSQGTHTIRVDSATIAPGLIVDREYQTLKVLGGQTTSVQFSVGNFAGITGIVAAQDATGAKRPLSDIGISVDGIQAVTTSPDGHYQIGRLSPGAHTIEIVDATVPSTVQFIADKKKTVTVSAGTSTPLNFLALPLGSIAGSVVAPADGGFGALVGLRNVYVVADPGEHAVITNEDGSFLMDNMPPGTYTLTVDPDTIPDGLSVLSGPDGPLAVQGAAPFSGIIFKLGTAAKNVVFTYSDGRRMPIQVEVTPAIAPPGSLLRVSARTSAKDVALAVESDVFGAFPLRLDARTGAWTGSTVVPALVKGDYALTVTAHRQDVTDASSLVPVDPRIPLFAVHLNPRAPGPRQTAHVMLKSLAPAEEGDSLVFEDGYKIVLPKPVGHLFVFDVRVWSRGLPYSATLLTKRGPTYPISLR